MSNKLSSYDLVTHLHRQKKFSEETFGPAGHRKTPAGLIEHISKELKEIEADPHDIMEWIDVVILALDGAWRFGYTPEEIAAALADKLAINEKREWPDWHTQPTDRCIEHIRSAK